MPIRLRWLRLLAVAAAGLSTAAARAEPPAPDRASQQMELRGVETNLKTSEAEQRKIEADVEALSLDRTRLNAALLETTARLQQIEQDRAEATARLAKASGDAASLEASFGARRERLGQLLAALQRMTHDAPPAIFVKPDDMAAAVRAAGVVNGLIGDIKGEADALSRDLTRVSELKRTIAGESERLSRSAEALAVDQARLSALIDARQKTLGDRESALSDERKRVDQLAAEATNLKDLIARMDGDAASDQAAAAVVKSRAARPGGDVARLKPAAPFSEAKGRLPWPVAGAITKSFGDPDGSGGQMKGLTISAPPAATVSTPADAWVAYAGPYRSYGQLLILNAGEGYYMILAGMERIDVSVGQFVLAGEPVAVMGSGGGRVASAAGTGAVGIGAVSPALYIEFRKNDTVIDPQPWWAKSNLEKARG